MASAADGGNAAAKLRGGGGVALAMLVLNVTTYGFTIAGAHILGPTDYGALAAWMNLLLVVNVGSLGLQATAARRLSSGEHDLDDVEPHLVRLTLVSSAVLGIVLLVLTPLINVTLQLDDLLMAALLGVSAVPLTVVGGLSGILQGERRWGALSAVQICIGVPRLVVGVGLMLWRPDPRWAAIAVAVTLVIPVAVGLHALRHRRLRPGHRREGLRSLVLEMVHNSQALLAFFAVSNVDLIVARHTLDSHDAGLYAAGLILAKAVLFLPQFVSIVAFPSMASDDSSRTFVAAVGAVAALGAVATLATALLPGLALIFVGGSEYADVRSQLWVFAVLGTLLAMLMMVVYGLLARGGQRSVYVTWVALAAIIGIGLTATTIGELLTVVIVVDAVLVLVLLVAHQRSVPGPRATRATALQGPTSA
ncbi:MAG TPA: polysaccharide biosynthesis protein [Nocardioides sp.]|jgi:O-antigen/teichoic acid export membrane protein|nr:polysaccharide biosynthesis protein [Nocardioides sp.]